MRLLALLLSCSDDDDMATVSFSERETEIVTDTLTPVDIELDISPSSPTASNIRIIAPQNSYGEKFVTEPPLEAGEIDVPLIRVIIQ